MGGNDDYDWLSDAAGSDSGNTNDTQVNNNNANQTTPSSGENNSAALAAESILNSRNLNSEHASQLCNVLNNPNATQNQIRSQLDTVIEELENESKIKSKLDSVDKNTSSRQLESIREELIHINTDTSKAVTDLLEVIIDLKEDMDQKDDDMGKYEEAVTRGSECVSQNCERVFRSQQSVEKLNEFSDAVEKGEIIIRPRESSVENIIEDIKYDMDIESREAQNLLESLKNPGNQDAQRNITSSIETIDELSGIKNTVEDITRDDILRRLDSIKSDLELKDTPIYRHLEDRIRELEAMIDNGGTDPVQRYAVYQEITFYDRTLIPRLSRSMDPTDVSDINQEIESVENRIASIKDNYISVRADHNHSIPNHFIELTEDLCAQSKQTKTDNAEIAAGIVSSSNALLDYIEDLYEKNEYSVMLRRLRG